MMINEKLLPKAYREVLEILKYIPKDDYDKVPKYIIENMKKEQDTEYNFSVTEFECFEQQEMLEETEIILVVLYRDYWATDDDKKIISEIESLEKIKLESEKKEKYTPLNNVFEKVGSAQEEEKSNGLLPIKQESFWKKIVKRIKNFLKR